MTRNLIRNILTVLVAAGFCAYRLPCHAEIIKTYPGTFNYRIPASPDDSKGWMEEATIFVPDSFTINDLDINLNINHTNILDLQIFLVSPADISVCLNYYDVNEGFFIGQNYTNTTFDDEASTPIEDAQAPFTGRFRPKAQNSLEAFTGENTFGQWKLRIYDAFYNDTGYLEDFTLIITIPEPASSLLFILGPAFVHLLSQRRK